MPPTRNTINQRASRARRKDYIGDLERKVRDFETQGVQATEQVQRAARRVADENRALREEMQALRARNAELENLIATGIASANADGHSHPGYQQSNEASVPVGYSNTSNLGSKPAEQQYPSPPQAYEPQPLPLPPTSVERNGTPGTIPLVNPSPHAWGTHIPHASSTEAPNEQHSHIATELLPPTTQSDEVSIYSYSATIDDDVHHGEDTTADSYPTNSGASDLSNCCVGPNSTSCAQAAMIIAKSEILPQLGCDVGGGCGPAKSACPAPDLSPRITYKDAQNCTVDNVRLFGILDQEKSLA
ncbi:hypothetical protein LTR10_021622 [Elasticomyces elasticus]|uniref:BZIP domain-containing protein n=1 Tax=Exophiala sideris TaxID=1016849 RepID=A0ABR0J289_9EURO|nr:hypothetical protein LTR10_021622 [Elasticomyces elasticus]KAK5024134.1 hypothetical protein LTS07_008869 [Exophiala sideris]KAK5029006.1 hypothetical protein LTR13_008876 [Exophiala sideris]KAK5054846.1 hypothetical protein LTR69_008754 [Exophiala sideris]KAK5178829.1 hypothetical protein LTR44_008657 [Eurotiomycetes sp. CCFEE 6388]